MFFRCCFDAACRAALDITILPLFAAADAMMLRYAADAAFRCFFFFSLLFADDCATPMPIITDTPRLFSLIISSYTAMLISLSIISSSSFAYRYAFSDCCCRRLLLLRHDACWRQLLLLRCAFTMAAFSIRCAYACYALHIYEEV